MVDDVAVASQQSSEFSGPKWMPGKGKCFNLKIIFPLVTSVADTEESVKERGREKLLGHTKYIHMNTLDARVKEYLPVAIRMWISLSRLMPTVAVPVRAGETYIELCITFSSGLLLTGPILSTHSSHKRVEQMNNCPGTVSRVK